MSDFWYVIAEIDVDPSLLYFRWHIVPHAIFAQEPSIQAVRREDRTIYTGCSSTYDYQGVILRSYAPSTKRRLSCQGGICTRDSDTCSHASLCQAC
jgi:hypothetical protein